MDDVDTAFVEAASKMGLAGTAKAAVAPINDLVRRAKDFCERENVSEDGDKELLSILQQAFDAGFDIGEKAVMEVAKKAKDDSDSLLPGV
jgi:hypothetical protein